MTAKSILGGVLLLILSLGLTANVNQVQPDHNFMLRTKAITPPPLSTEQKVLVDHLSDKYDKPLNQVERIVRVAYTEAKKHSLSPLLVLAIIEKESSLKDNARSNYGAVGLMQVVPRYHLEKLKNGEKSQAFLVPETNIRVGTQILSDYMLKNNGNLKKALKKYSGNAADYSKTVIVLKTNLEKVTRTAVA